MNNEIECEVYNWNILMFIEAGWESKQRTVCNGWVTVVLCSSILYSSSFIRNAHGGINIFYS